MDRDFPCFSQQLAGYLMMKGFILQGFREDYKNPKLNICLFRDSEELREVVSQFKRNKNNLK